MIKVDTGLSRNGCQPKDLPALMQVGICVCMACFRLQQVDRSM